MVDTAVNLMMTDYSFNTSRIVVGVKVSVKLVWNTQCNGFLNQKIQGFDDSHKILYSLSSPHLHYHAGILIIYDFSM